MAVIRPPLSFSIKSLSRCIDASTLSSMLANPLSPSFLGIYSLPASSLGCITFYMVISSLVHLFKFISGSLQKGSQLSNEGYNPRIHSFEKVSAREFSSSPVIFFLNFVFPLHLFEGVILQDAQVYVGFVFTERCNLILIW